MNPALTGVALGLAASIRFSRRIGSQHTTSTQKVLSITLGTLGLLSLLALLP